MENNFQNDNNPEVKNLVANEGAPDKAEANAKAGDVKEDKKFKVLKIIGCAVAIVGVAVGAFFGITALCGGGEVAGN